MSDTKTNIIGKDVKLYDNNDGTNSLSVYNVNSLPLQVGETDVSNANPLPTQNLVPQTFTFHNAVSATGNGNVFTVGNYKTITLSGIGTSTSRTVEFHGIDANGVDDLINGFNRDFVQATGFTINSKAWQISIEGYVSFYCKITAIAGGNETIIGQVTA